MGRKFTNDPCIQSIECAIDRFEFDPKKDPPKPMDVPLKNAYQEFEIVVQLSNSTRTYGCKSEKRTGSRGVASVLASLPSSAHNRYDLCTRLKCPFLLRVCTGN